MSPCARRPRPGVERQCRVSVTSTRLAARERTERREAVLARVKPPLITARYVEPVICASVGVTAAPCRLSCQRCFTLFRHIPRVATGVPARGWRACSQPARPRELFWTLSLENMVGFPALYRPEGAGGGPGALAVRSLRGGWGHRTVPPPLCRALSVDTLVVTPEQVHCALWVHFFLLRPDERRHKSEPSRSTGSGQLLPPVSAS